MELQHIRSDWNDTQSDNPYHDTPTEYEVQHALDGFKVYSGDSVILAKGELCEVKCSVASGLGVNTYKDLYRIIK